MLGITSVAVSKPSPIPSAAELRALPAKFKAPKMEFDSSDRSSALVQPKSHQPSGDRSCPTLRKLERCILSHLDCDGLRERHVCSLPGFVALPYVAPVLDGRLKKTLKVA